MKKTCLVCAVSIDDSSTGRYNGENGWFCKDCCSDMSKRFTTIFCEQIEESHCGPVLSWSAIHRILGLVERNRVACLYQISDFDRAQRQAGKPITTDDIAEHLEALERR